MKTLSPSADISTPTESDPVVLLRFILSQDACPPSVKVLNITYQFPDLFENQATYSFSPITTDFLCP
jgi:hypothetical protein